MVVKRTITLYDVRMSVARENKPGAVYTAPDKTPLPFQWADGAVTFSIPRVNGHSLVCIEA